MEAPLHPPRRPPTPWAPLLGLAALWALLPALPALLSGQLIGHGWTDLYPAVWGLWASAAAWPAVPTETALLGAPAGMPWVYSSPIHGWLAGPLVPVLGLRHSWNLLLLLARGLTVACAGWAASGWGLGRRGALTLAVAFGCSPFFQGYAVEGIVEGTDGWPLALLLGALGRGRHALAALALALCLLASWYLGAVGCALVGLLGLQRPRRWWAFLGIALALPALLRFLQAFPAGAPLDPSVRAAMGAALTLPRPGALPGLQPFAINTFVGLALGGAALLGRGPGLGLAAVFGVLSVGIGPWYALPGFAMLRFPYRWHAGALLGLGLAAGRWADQRRARRWLPALILAEGLLLSPIEPILPGADPSDPLPCALLDEAAQVTGPLPAGALLVVPGPVGLPPGRPNPSRGRARAVLFAQTCHGRPSPWVPDFNSVGVAREATLLEPFLAYDRVARGRGGAMPEGLVRALADQDIRLIFLALEDPGLVEAPALEAGLQGQGARLLVERAAGGRRIAALYLLPENGVP